MICDYGISYIFAFLNSSRDDESKINEEKVSLFYLQETLSGGEQEIGHK